MRLKPLIIGVLFAVLLLGLIGFRFLSARGVQGQLAVIQATGLPVSPSELNAWYSSVPTNENRAVVILAAAKLLVKGSECTDQNYIRSLKADDVLSPAIENAVRACLAANRTPLDELLRNAERLNDSRYPVDLSLGWNTTLPHLAKLKELVQLLRIEVIEQSHVGKTEKAVRALEAGFALADSLRNEPLLISDLVRLKCIEITLSGLERLLNERQLTSEQLIALSRKVAEAQAVGHPALVRALVGERAVGIGLFQMSFKSIDGLLAPSWPLEGSSGLKQFQYQFYRGSGMDQRDLHLYLEGMEGFIKSSREEFPVGLRQFRQMEKEMTARFSKGLTQFAILGRTLLNPLGGAAQKEANSAARLRRVELALAIERFRLDHNGALPDFLNKLVSAYLLEIPVDPCDGSLLMYEHLQSKGYRVISPSTAADRGSSTGSEDRVLSVLR